MSFLLKEQVGVVRGVQGVISFLDKKTKSGVNSKRIQFKSVYTPNRWFRNPKAKIFLKTTKDLKEKILEKDVDISECRYVFGEEEKHFSKEEIEYQVNVGGTAEIGYEQARETSVRFFVFFRTVDPRLKRAPRTDC